MGAPGLNQIGAVSSEDTDKALESRALSSPGLIYFLLLVISPSANHTRVLFFTIQSLSHRAVISQFESQKSLWPRSWTALTGQARFSVERSATTRGT